MKNSTKDKVVLLLILLPILGTYHVMLFFSTAATNENTLSLNNSDIWRTLRERAQHMHKVCDRNGKSIIPTHPDYVKAPNLWFGYDWMVIRKYNIFWCATPKCSSSTLKRLFLLDNGVKIVPKSVDALHNMAAFSFSYRYFRHNNMSARLPLYEVNAKASILEGDIPPFSVITVRNPWDRIFSAYKNKIIDEKIPLINFCKQCQMAKDIPDGKATFSEFVDCINDNLDRKLDAYDDHVMPMTNICALCLLNYDYIVKVENLREEMLFVLSKLEDDRSNLINLFKNIGKINSSSRRKNLQQNVYKQLTEAQITRLKAHYRNDFLLFQYSDDPFNITL